MIQINDSSFEIVYKINAIREDKTCAGGVIFANSNKEALNIAKQLVNDIQNRINTKGEEDNDI